jgi:hypothetical protein
MYEVKCQTKFGRQMKRKYNFVSLTCMAQVLMTVQTTRCSYRRQDWLWKATKFVSTACHGSFPHNGCRVSVLLFICMVYPYKIVQRVPLDIRFHSHLTTSRPPPRVQHAMHKSIINAKCKIFMVYPVHKLLNNFLLTMVIGNPPACGRYDGLNNSYFPSPTVCVCVCVCWCTVVSVQTAAWACPAI